MMKWIFKSALLFGAALSTVGCASTDINSTNADGLAVSTDGSVTTTQHIAMNAGKESRTATLMVKGLACPFCVQNVDKQISAIAGVDDVTVDLDTGRVTVILSETNPASKGLLVKAIDDSGFTLDRIEMP